MTQSNDDSNLEHSNVTNIPRSDRSGDVTEPKGRFLSKEAIVLVSIICMSLFNGLSIYLQPRDPAVYPQKFLMAYNPWAFAVAIVGVMSAAFLSEVAGRKPVYLYLFSLSFLSSILILVSQHVVVLGSTNILGWLTKGGFLVMNALAISEYSSPKHRFAWMILNEAACNIIRHLVLSVTLVPENLLYTRIVIVILIILELICLGSFWVWPESPYWLASKGKLEQSREAFMWLRGKEGSEELASMLKARRHPGPPKLFWISLLIALATMLVAIFSDYEIMLSRLYSKLATNPRKSEFYTVLFGGFTFTFILVAVSCVVKRKLLFIVVTVASFVLSYGKALWLYLASDSDLDGVLFDLLFDVSHVITEYGPRTFGVTLYVEIAPFKYNTTISCICFVVQYLFFSIFTRLGVYLYVYTNVHSSVLLTFCTTVSLIAALLYYFFAPETKDKTLLEIQKSYTSDENDSIPDQNETMMLNAI